MNEIFWNKVLTNLTGITFESVSKSIINRPAPMLLIAAIIWFSVMDERNRPIEINLNIGTFENNRSQDVQQLMKEISYYMNQQQKF